MKSKLFWLGLVACVCLIAGQVTLNATGTDAATTRQAVEAFVPLMGPESDALELPSAEAPGRVSTKPKISHYKTPSDRPEGRINTISTLPRDAKAFAPTTSTLLPEYQVRQDHGNSLDEACTLNGANTPQGGWLSWISGPADGFYVWVDPADCPTPGYPFLIETVTFTGATSSGFGEPIGGGTLTYRIVIAATSEAGTDPCANPGEILCTSPDLTLDDTGQGLVDFTYTFTDCCVERAFFIGMQFISYTGTAGLCPSPLWENIANTPCYQWLHDSGPDDWTDYQDFFTNGETGVAIYEVTGNTNDTCDPIVPVPPIGACCDYATGNCVDSVTAAECTGTFEIFTANTLCADLDPACEICVPPAHDDCANAVPLTFGQQYCDSVPCHFDRCDEDISGVWHSFTIDQCCFVEVAYCGSQGTVINAYLNLFSGCPCDGPVDFFSPVTYDTDSCGDGHVTIYYEYLLAGTYYIAVIPDLFPNYCVQVDTSHCPPCEPDFEAFLDCTENDTLRGNTVGALDDCNWFDGEDHIWELQVTEAAEYSFYGCNVVDPGGEWDMVLILADSCCGDIALCADDDGCGTTFGQSWIFCCPLEVGTYYLMVEGWTLADGGQYEIIVSCCPPCVVDCQQTNDENETPCDSAYVDTYNGGCLSEPPAWNTPALCNDGYCGVSGTFEVDSTTLGRDTDWYHHVELTEQNVTCCLVAEFDASLYFVMIDDTCGFTTLYSYSHLACSTMCITVCVPPYDGQNIEYAWVVQPYDFEGVPCDADYEITWTCEPCPDCTQEPLCGTPTEQEPNDICTELIADTLTCGDTVYAAICEAGDVDHFVWVVPPLIEATFEVYSGDNCDEQPSVVVLSILDANCVNLVPGDVAEVGWTTSQPGTYIIAAQALNHLIETNYMVTVTCDSSALTCVEQCELAEVFPCGDTLTVNTCDGCQLYDGNYQLNCTGSAWSSGLQWFFQFTLSDTDSVYVQVWGDSTGTDSTEDVQFMVFNYCEDPTNPDSSCVCSQDQNYPPSNVITGPTYTEQGWCELPPGTYHVGVSCYAPTANPDACGPIHVWIDCAGGPCEPADSLTVIREGANVVLRWIAPHDETWKVYKTDIPNHVPDPADDPGGDWSLVGSVTGTGPLQLTDPEGFPTGPLYRNYVVVPDCHLDD